MIEKLNLLITIILAITGGIFWRMGGSGNYSRYWRRIGVALLLTFLCFIRTFSLYSLLVLPIAYLSFCLGYGLPSADDPIPSKLGEFFSRYIKNRFWLQMIVRGICGFAYSLSFIVWGILTHNFLWMGIGMIVITLVTPLITILNRDVLEENLIGASIVLFAQLI